MRKRLEAQIRAHATAANDIVALADREDRTLSPEEWSKVQAELGKASELHKEVKKIDAIAPDLSSLSHLGLNENPTDADVRRVVPANHKFNSAGAAFVASEEYKALVATKGSGAWEGKGRRVNMGAEIQVPTGMLLPGPSRRRAELVTGSSEDLLGETTDSAGVLVQPDGPQWLPTTYARDLVVRDLLTTVPTSTDTIDYVAVATVTNNAAAVPEATSSESRHEGAVGPGTVGNPGGYKPESALTFKEQKEHVRTIAHTIPVTKKALADAPQIRVIIDVFLRYGLDEKVEDLILAGDGTGENFLGLLAQSREQSGPGVLDGVQQLTGADDLLVKARKAKTMSRLARGGRPTAYLMHPNTWEEYVLTRDGEDRFRAGGPFQDTEPPLWGLPVVESEAMPEGLVVTGNFRQAVYYDRQRTTLTATDSHEDFFIRNLVMILAELRGGFALLHPQTFVKFHVEPDSAVSPGPGL